jgi:hypothetical protein
MKPVIPDITEEVLPEGVELHKFEHPHPEVEDIYGMVHTSQDPSESSSIEFMFELTEEELNILKVKPLLTLVILGEASPVFQLLTSYPSAELARKA